MYPRLILAAIVAAALAGAYAYAYHAGGVASDQRHAIAAAKLAAQVQEAVDVQIAYGNRVSLELEEATAAMNVKQVEVIKYVTKVTRNTACLSPRAVRLLNFKATAAPVVSAPAAPLDEKGAAGPAATDRDVAYWVTDARTRYQECAQTLNSLITFEERR